MRSEIAAWKGLFLSIGLCGLSTIGGCADESKTTGTQVQLTAKDRAEIEDMRAAMKGQQAARKQEQRRPVNGRSSMSR